MIHLLHGDNTEASRAALKQLSAAPGKEIRVIDGRNLNQTDLTQALESGSLFAGPVSVVIENFLTNAGRKTKSLAALIQIILGSARETEIILWESKELSKAQVMLLGTGVDIRLFKTPKVIFRFLDGLKPGSSKESISLFRMMSAEVPEIIFTMTVRRVRHLIMAKDGVTPPGVASWQESSLTTQAKSFTMDKLLSMHKSLTEIEYSIKSGSSPYDLSTRLQLFLADL